MLKIISYPIIKLIDGPIMVQAGGMVTSGGAGAQRNITVYGDRGLIRVMGNTISSVIGVWSLSCLGGGSSRFTVIAWGLPGENNIMYADCEEG